MAAHQTPLSLGLSRQEHWSGLPFPSPMHESEKWKWGSSVVSDSSRPHGLQPTRFLRAWDFPGKSTGVGCHCLLHLLRLGDFNYTLWFLGQTGLTKFTPAWPEPPYVERQLALLLWLLIGSLFESCYSTSLYFISSYLKWREYLPSGLRCSEEHSAKCRDSVSCQLFRRKL